MASSRVLRALAAVGHEWLRLQHADVRRVAAAAAAHAVDLSRKLPLAVATVTAPVDAGVTQTSSPPPTPVATVTLPPPRDTAPVDASAAVVSPAAVTVDRALPLPPHLDVPPPRRPESGLRHQADHAGSAVPAPATTAPPPPPPIPGQQLPEPAVAATPQPAKQPLPAVAPPSLLPPPVPASPARVFVERAVPASPLARLWGFGSLAASMAVGAASEAVGRALGGSAPAASTRAPTAADGGGGGSGDGGDGTAVPQLTVLSEAQAQRLAAGLCRMRGAALKLGQMLSLSDEGLLPPVVAAALERVRTQADVMPRRQLEQVMREELGPDWRSLLGGAAFSDAPVAAASIGQVHRTTLPDGRVVAVKVQYPGVAESINSDIANLRRLLQLGNFLPRGLYMDSVLSVAREELTAECDYRREAAAQERFRALVGGDADFEVPAVVRDLSTRRVLVTTWLPGMPIDKVAEVSSQEVRNHIARKLLKLTLKELFEWRFMQTDPNWGNFFYDAASGRIGLLDFGASREFPKAFVDDYLRLVWAAANRDRDTIEKVSLKLRFLTGLETQVMLDAHVDSGLVVGEPFLTPQPFDFKASGITKRVARHGAVFAEHRLTPPPNEVYSLHRKLAGAFLICIRMGAVIPCRDMLEQTYRNHVWGDESGAPQAA